VTQIPSPSSFWGLHQTPSRSVVELIELGTLDAELAALLWLLLESRLPLVVAARPRRAGKSTTLNALLDFLPPDVSRLQLAGAWEDFGWLADAESLGWRREAGAGGTPVPSAPPEGTYLVAAELSDHLPVYTWGDRARVAIRAMSRGYGMGATIHAASLEEVFAALGGPPVGLTPDELSRIGVVLVLGMTGAGDRRITAAHYVRPVVRDAHGHVQRLGPAVLATSDASTGAFEHFAWGVLPELAERTGRKAGDFELEQKSRADYLQGLAVGGVTEVEAVRTALQGYRLEGMARTGN
jgi:hypothetical protein